MARHTAAAGDARRPRPAGGGTAPAGPDGARDRRAPGPGRAPPGEGAVAGRGLAVLLTGEAGMGKTTLLTEAARYAEGAGARAAWGSGWPGDGAPGYWPWVQVLRALGLDARLSRDAVGTAADEAP